MSDDLSGSEVDELVRAMTSVDAARRELINKVDRFVGWDILRDARRDEFWMAVRDLMGATYRAGRASRSTPLEDAE